ncbi:hypothetical protein [Tengunoibacter tsumagoiensis]|uniref:Uncharacterized protein n=1 Tax=Tengunoibacter tsumagoiensis TaxID=2014871 RepID=A0A402A056_9CHLR|nr:hypothetical protein [Tengunoibacter tsumagoiensis]GCE12401.1 hypothetical protein KTT_22600 [Tengunoibacter tsumagoiensis]
MNAYLKDWPLVEQVAELTCTMTLRKTGNISREVSTLFPPLTSAEVTPQRLLALILDRAWLVASYVLWYLTKEKGCTMNSTHSGL